MKRVNLLLLPAFAALLMTSAPALALDLNPFDGGKPDKAVPTPEATSAKAAPEASDVREGNAYELSKSNLQTAEQRAEEARQRALQALRDSEEAQKDLARAQKEVQATSPKEMKRQAKAAAELAKREAKDREEAQKQLAKQEEEAADKRAEAADKNGKNWKPNSWFGNTPEQQASLQTASTLPTSTTEWSDEMLESKAVQVATERGNFIFELYPKDAPVTVRNFVRLVNAKFYDQYNMKFHRVIPGFVVQTGDPTGSGAGGAKERIPLEIKNKLSHDVKGMVAMARGPDPNSATSQFYVTLAPETTLDGKYAIFGRVISGVSVLDKISQGDMVYSVTLVDKAKVARDTDLPQKKGFFSFGTTKQPEAPKKN